MERQWFDYNQGFTENHQMRNDRYPEVRSAIGIELSLIWDELKELNRQQSETAGIQKIAQLLFDYKIFYMDFDPTDECILCFYPTN